MTIQSQQDIEALKRVGAIVSSVLKSMFDSVEPGMTTAELDDNDRRVLREGMPIAIEPFLSTKSTVMHETGHGWTLAARGNLSAQYEHTSIVTRGAPIVLTAH